MPRTVRTITGGVDTHSATHHAAVLDRNGQLLGDAQFAATAAVYQELLGWMRSHGRLDGVGVEGTDAYGAGLARYLHDHGVTVLEVPRPERRLRRAHGKSDPLDAEAAARTVLAGKASGAPKLADGPIEAMQMIRVTRAGALKARTAAINTLHNTVVTAPEALRTQLRSLNRGQLIDACMRLRPDTDRLTDPARRLRLVRQDRTQLCIDRLVRRRPPPAAPGPAPGSSPLGILATPRELTSASSPSRRSITSAPGPDRTGPAPPGPEQLDTATFG